MYVCMYVCMYVEKREGKERGREMLSVVVPCVPPTGNLACNSGICPDWESNQQPFGLQAGAQSSEPHQPGLSSSF